ncbi:hypothetical protein Patl1_25980 [Pistacia atlantica]|uniref:Uncharacterized protein n=1 Tax=Pistacia atlantica TaxID=434234 RepID=A0ACC1B2K8_9ROSI|nr:hypothetical protein Patl1_25980 [Pistacia atlantica]
MLDGCSGVLVFVSLLVTLPVFELKKKLTLMSSISFLVRSPYSRGANTAQVTMKVDAALWR